VSDHGIDSRDRYNRYAEDWRFHHRLIWEIPGITSVIFGGIVTASYSLLGFLPRSILLFVGAVLVLGLTLAVRKHRFGADLRTNFLAEIGHEEMDFPIRSDKGLDYLRKRGQRKGRADGFLVTRSSEVYLIWFMFVAFLSLSILFILTIYQTVHVSLSLANEGKTFSQILANITTTANTSK
jgi:hypothetical protein